MSNIHVDNAVRRVVIDNTARTLSIMSRQATVTIRRDGMQGPQGIPGPVGPPGKDGEVDFQILDGGNF